MAESKQGGSKNFGKVLQKTVFRTKEKVLQNLGKADKTQDEEFDMHVANFTKQQMVAVRLQKELKTYLQSVKAMSAASKVFYEAVRDSYEDSWTGHSDMTGAVEALAAIWEDYILKLTHQVCEPLNEYVARFPEVKHKIAKRNRKLMDYDGTRHVRDSLINQKKKDEVKINKAHDEMNAAKKIYQDINSQLHEELPNFYESRKSVLSSALNSFFTSEAKFQEESAKIKNTLADVTERLHKESSDVFFKQYNHSPHVSSNHASTTSTPLSGGKLQHIPNDTSSNHSSSNHSNHSTHSNQDVAEDLATTQLDSEKPDISIQSEKAAYNITNGDVGSSITNTSPEASNAAYSMDEDQTYENVTVARQATQNTVVTVVAETENDKSSMANSPDVIDQTRNNNESKVDDNGRDDSDDDDDEHVYKVPTNNEPVGKDTVLYQVEATHPYTGEDTDELTFETGDRINVIPYEDPEEQDDGWLMGIKVSDGQVGVFPENFTKRVS